MIELSLSDEMSKKERGRGAIIIIAPLLVLSDQLELVAAFQPQPLAFPGVRSRLCTSIPALFALLSISVKHTLITARIILAGIADLVAA